MKIATWNVNSVRARLPHLQAWLGARDLDVILLQETKTTDEKFPFTELQDLGYHCAHHGQPAYNGVAILSRTPPQEIIRGIPNRPNDPQARVIAATIDGVRVLSAYVPNGQQVGADKYLYKLEWLADFADYLSSLAAGKTVAGGDYNIAPADEDIYDAEAWGEGILASPEERRALSELMRHGYRDAYRLFQQPEKGFTWWDYRAAAFRRNLGLRIDLFLVSDSVAAKSAHCHPDLEPRGWERPSDHTPVILEFDA